MSKALVVAVHPDDETLGCGGTLLKHKKQGDKIYWIIVTSLREDNVQGEKRTLKRKKEIEKVAEKYGFEGIFELGFPTMELDQFSINEIINKISGIFKSIEPEIIYLPYKGDVHSDHRITFDAAYSCTKNFRYPFIKKVLMMETLSETEFAPSLIDSFFIPNYFVDISETMDEKLKIMGIYKGEVEKHPFPRSLKNIKALANYRGAQAGCKYAESFMLLKEVA